MSFPLTVNGVPRTIEADPEMPLLWVLRDILSLTGTKYGCGLGLCGACTVHLENQAVRSCQTPLKAAARKQVTTIEGLSTNHAQSIQQTPILEAPILEAPILEAPILEAPILRAWIAEDVPQCGYCQPGQIMSASALLAANPHPTSAEIDTAMNGNICRCGTYPRIRRAIQHAAQLISQTAAAQEKP